jgi:hypothetical protein
MLKKKDITIFRGHNKYRKMLVLTRGCNPFEPPGRASSDPVDRVDRSVRHDSLRAPQQPIPISRHPHLTAPPLLLFGMGSSDLAVPDFWSLTCGPCIWWDPHVSESKSGKVRIGKLEDPAPSSSSPDAHAHALLCPAPPRLASSSPAARRRFRRGHLHPHSTTLLLRSPLSPPNLALPSTPTQPPATPCILNRRRGPAS